MIIDNPDISTLKSCLDLDMLNKASKFRVGDKIIVRVGNSDSGEPIYVTMVDDPTSEDLSVFDEAPSVVISDLTEIITYVVPVSKTFQLDRIEVSGDNIAKYIVTINGSTNKIKRTYYGGALNETFIYGGRVLLAGDEIKVEVIHYNDLLESGDFNATIEGRLKNE